MPCREAIAVVVSGVPGCAAQAALQGKTSAIAGAQEYGRAPVQRSGAGW